MFEGFWQITLMRMQRDEGEVNRWVPAHCPAQGDDPAEDEDDVEDSSPAKKKNAKRLGSDRGIWIRQRQVREKFEEIKRRLNVREVVLTFASSHGNRSSFHPCLLVTSMQDNFFHRCAAWRDRLVQGAVMLTRKTWCAQWLRLSKMARRYPSTLAPSQMFRSASSTLAASAFS